MSDVPTGIRPVHLLAGVVATMAMASSSVLVHWAAAPAVALAFWRTLGGGSLLAATVALRPGSRSGSGSGSRSRTAGRSMPYGPTLIAGVALGIHFWTWLASLERTSVAASVTLVSTAPIFVALGRAVGGERLSARSWAALAAMFVGVVLIATDGDVEAGEGAAHSLTGDALALVGAVAMAVYLEVGGRVRSEVDTARYASVAYLSAAAILVPAALVSGQALAGFDATTWTVIVAMTLGPQMAGHTVLNALLERVGSFTVSLLLLAEPVGATVLALVFLDQRPGVRTLCGVAAVLAGLGWHLAGRPGGRANHPTHLDRCSADG